MEKMMPVVNFGTEDKPVLAAFRDLVSLTNFVDFYFKNTSLEYVSIAWFSQKEWDDYIKAETGVREDG